MTKPVGQPTRGFTAPNRLRLVDTYVLLALREHLRHMAGVFVDLGFGALPLTTLESFERFRKVNPNLLAVGVEIDPERVRAAEQFSRPGLSFRHGGFNLPLAREESVGLVRAFNVLRQYEERDVGVALATLAAGMAPGAILLEGTSDPPGRHVAFWVWQRTTEPFSLARAPAKLIERRRLVLGARVHPAFSPRDLQPFLPKELIHHAQPGGKLDQLFDAWERAWLANASLAPRARWEAAASRLGHAVDGIDARPALASRGLLALRPGAVLQNDAELTSLRRGRRV